MTARLEFDLALDQAFAWLAPTHARLLAIVTTPAFADGVLDRAVAGLDLWCDGPTALRVRARLSDGSVPVEVAAQSRVVEPMPPHVAALPAGAAVWASPQRDSWTAIWAALTPALGAFSPLAILVGSPAGRWQELGRRGRERGEPEAVLPEIKRRLVADGWEVQREMRLAGLDAAAWTLAARVASVAARPDLADRAERARHDSLTGGALPSYELLLARRARAT